MSNGPPGEMGQPKLRLHFSQQKNVAWWQLAAINIYSNKV
jgi:hypothetical protein